MSRDFKQWAVLAILGTVLSELLIYFMFTPETRNDPMVRALMWVLLPTPAILSALLMGSTPTKAK